MLAFSVMRTQKVSVTLAADALDRARELAGPRGLSSYVDSALQEKLQRDAQRRAFLSYLDDLEASDPTPDHVRERASRRAARLRESVSR